MTRMLCALALAFATAGFSAAPNYVLFVADDLSFNDLHCWGSPDAKTPNLDRLAGEGMKLTRMYTAAPTCSPTRAALYTGLYPVKNGAHPNHSSVKPGVRSLPHYLKPLGYRVAIFGKTMIRPPEAFPFDVPAPEKGGDLEESDGDLPFGEIEKYMNQGDRPFCIVVASHEPHGPWTKGDSSVYDPAKLTIPPYLVDTPQLRRERAKYLAEVTYLDSEVGKVMELLKKTNHEKNTLLLFLSEQGGGMPRAKYNLYDPGVRSAAIARWPGRIKPGSECDALASYVDVVPTFIDAAGGKPENLDGRSFLEVLLGKRTRHLDYVYAQATSLGVNGVRKPYPIRAVRDERYKLIWNLNYTNDFPRIHDAANPESQWSLLAKTNAAARVEMERLIHRPEYELYDLQNDPWEKNNLADAASLTEARKRLKVRLDAWMTEQGDKGTETEMEVPVRVRNKAGKKGD